MTTDPTELTPAERLRAAAAKLRTLLTELGDCRGPWYVVNREQRPYPQRIDNIGVPYVIASTTTDPSTPPYLADYIALMHPRVGYAITQLLESLAARLDDSTSDVAQLLDPHALIAARLILESPGAPDATEPAPRAEDTLRDRMAAAIYETNICSPWASAHPDDVLAYGWDADAALRVRDDEMTELRQRAERAEAATVRTTAEACGKFVPDKPRAPGLCASCGDARGWHSRLADTDAPEPAVPAEPEEGDGV
ncbi:hypothetical protein AB0G97_09035 [Streptomyces sp. NPDC020755]|uniref:hypothetical protein n=1 Tax=Streptomyces sp. NPDC020755 TaxID=3154790 RepID=UPI0033C7BA60